MSVYVVGPKMKVATLTQNVKHTLDFLASMPNGSSVVERAELRELMLQTGGRLLAAGWFYDIKAKHLGAGVYQVSLERQK